MANIFSNDILQSSFEQAYKKNLLQSNYFVHKIGSPYDTNPQVNKDKGNLFNKIDKAINELKSENNVEEWSVRKVKQEALMRSIIGNKKLSGTKLIKQFNKEYLNYLSNNTVLFDKNGYYNIYVQEALRKELIQLYRKIKNINNKNYQFTNKVKTELFEYFEKEDLKSEIKKLLKDRIKELKSFTDKVETNKLSKYDRLDYYENLSRLEACNRLYNILNENKNFIIENIFIDASRKHKGKLNGQEAGRETELLFTEIAGNFIQEQLGNINIKQTGTGQMKIEASESLTKKAETYTIKTDVELELDSNVITNSLKEVEIKMLKQIENDDILKKDKIKFNFSMKNYKINTGFDISAQSNNNITSFLNILAKNTKTKGTLSFLKNENNIDNLQYYILNDLVEGRSQEDINVFKKQCQEIGINVLFALDSENDEVDFLVFNQRIIPSYFLLENIYKERQKAENNSSYSPFMIHLKKVQPVAIVDKSRTDKKNFLNGYYSQEYLESHRNYGEKLYNSMYMNTKIDKKFVLNIIKTITKQID